MRIMLLLAFLPCAALAAAPATQLAGPQSAKETERLEATIRRTDEVLKASPKNAAALQRRAEALCLLGRIDESVRDFDRVVELEPLGAAHNWQRGIALYYAGRFEDGAKQFEQHRVVNPQDVENAAWHYLCLSRAIGLPNGPAEARKKLIPIERDHRIPLMKIHELYSGKATPDDVLAAAKAGKPDDNELFDRLFYAHLYIGLYYEAQGDAAKAAEHIRLSTQQGADGYMADVAHLHAWILKFAGKPVATRPAKP
jgi:lipoprotein NlpI